MGILGKKQKVQNRDTGEKKYVVKTKALKRDILKTLNIKDYVESVGKDTIKLKRGTYVKVFLPREYPSVIPMGLLNEFIHTDYPTTIGVFLNRYPDNYALALLQRNLTVIKGEKYYYERLGAVNSEKYARLLREEEQTEELRSMILGKETHLFDITFTVSVRGRNYEEMKENAKRVEITFKGLNFKLHKGWYRIWEIFRTMLPIAVRDIPHYEPPHIHSDGAMAFFPFTSGAFSTLGPNAVLYGFNEQNNTPVLIDRFLYTSYNGLIFGKTGSGKSYFAKLMMIRSKLANPHVLIYSIDPLGEYGALVRELGGLNVKLWNPEGEGAVINPLDPAIAENEYERVKNIVALISTIFDLSREEEIFLDSMLHKMFKKYEGEEPVFGDLIEMMREQMEIIKRTEGESAAMRYSRLLDAMSIFEDGSLSFLNQPSTVDISEYSMVNFDLSGTPDDFIPFFMFFVTNFVYAKLKEKEGEKLFFIDEVHYLWKFMLCAERLNWMARHTRHYRTGMILMTQSANDGFTNEHTRAIMENTHIHLLLHHDNLSDEVRDFYKLNTDQESFVYAAHGGKGHGFSTGLLVVGMLKIPLKIVASEEEHRFLITG